MSYCLSTIDQEQKETSLIKKVVGYARESTKDQAINGFNLDEQERWIREYVDLYYKNDDVKFSMIREEGASAISLKRPQMNIIIEMIRNEEVDVIVVHNLDRLTRQLTDLHDLLELFQKYGVQLISLRENVDTETVQGKFFVSVIVLIAQWEEETIGERCIRGKRESARQGNYAKPLAPFGYYRNPENNHQLLIDENEASIVKRIFESIASGEHSFYTLAKILREEKVCGKMWVQSYLERMIKNKIYFGTFSWYDEEFDDHQPAIISRELWVKANEMSRSKGFRYHNYLFKEKVRCMRCKCLCEESSTTKSNGRAYLYYVCPKCNTYFNESKVYAGIEDDLNNMVRNHHFYYEVRLFNNRYKLADRKLFDTAYDYAYFRFSKEYYHETMAKYAAMRDQAKQQLDVLKPEIIRKTFRTISYEERNELMEKYLDHINVDPSSFVAVPCFTEAYMKVKNHGC